MFLLTLKDGVLSVIWWNVMPPGHAEYSSTENKTVAVYLNLSHWGCFHQLGVRVPCLFPCTRSSSLGMTVSFIRLHRKQKDFSDLITWKIQAFSEKENRGNLCGRKTWVSYLWLKDERMLNHKSQVDLFLLGSEAAFWLTLWWEQILYGGKL